MEVSVNERDRKTFKVVADGMKGLRRQPRCVVVAVVVVVVVLTTLAAPSLVESSSCYKILKNRSNGTFVYHSRHASMIIVQ
jgi:hypothetical protein